jgi:DNA-binding response OmpR family regulator
MADAPAPAPPAKAARIVLVVDDKGTTRDIVIHSLKNQGYDTLSAENGADALKVATERKVDLIIMDVMMPKMDGFTVCEKLRAGDKTRGIPVLICTAKNQREDVMQAVFAGANDYLVKPFSRAQLLAKVKKLLGEGA